MVALEAISYGPDAIAFLGLEGNFLKVTTANRVIGYISQSARDHVIATPGN